MLCRKNTTLSIHLLQYPTPGPFPPFCDHAAVAECFFPPSSDIIPFSALSFILAQSSSTAPPSLSSCAKFSCLTNSFHCFKNKRPSTLGSLISSPVFASARRCFAGLGTRAATKGKSYKSSLATTFVKRQEEKREELDLHSGMILDTLVERTFSLYCGRACTLRNEYADPLTLSLCLCNNLLVHFWS